MQRDGVKERIISQWLEKAEQDLKAAEALASGETFLYFPACFHAQQAVEKFLKALLTDLQVEFPKTHSIEYLIQLLKPHFPALPPVLLDPKFPEFITRAIPHPGPCRFLPVF